MKILHTGDWHIGKLVHGIHMTDDQKIVLENLINLIKDKKPDVLIISGDLYDRSIPPVEAVSLLDKTLTDIIVNTNTKIIAISGNHDSSDRVSFANELLKTRGLHVYGCFESEIKPLILEDEYGKVNFYPFPYFEPALIREAYGDDSIKDHQDALSAVVKNIQLNDSERNIAIYHGLVYGINKTDESESERPLSIGGSEMVDASLFNGFDYTALGHLHKAQSVMGDKMRYSGSLMKYSFSEAYHKKSVTMIDLGKKGKMDVELYKLIPKKDMRIIEGKLEELIKKDVYEMADTNDYIMARLTDAGELIEPMATLRSVYPNVLRLERVFMDLEYNGTNISARSETLKKEAGELFEEFYENISGKSWNEDLKKHFLEIVDEGIKKGRNS